MAAKSTKRTGGESSSPQQEPEVDMLKAGRWLQEVAVIVNNTLKHYWFSKADADTDTKQCYGALVEILKSCPQVTVRIVGGFPSVNGKPLELKDPVLDALFVHLVDIGVDNFYIVSGATSVEFFKFCEIISALRDEVKQLGGFSAVLDKFELKNIRTKKLIVREIADSEILVSKDEYERSGKGGPGAEGPGGNVGDILAFLRGDVTAKDTALSETVREAASDPERMAELILQAADVRQQAELEGGETIGEFVVGCLRRTFEAISKDPSMKTATGKKKVARNFIMLEEAILKRMREMPQGDVSEADLDAIESAADQITDEIKIDALAEEYVNKVAAVQESQGRLMNFMKQEGVSTSGETVIQKKFAERGLSMPGWQQLVVKGGTGSGGGGPGFSNTHILDAIGHLDALLDNMEKEFTKMSKAQQDESAKKMWMILEDVNAEVGKLTVYTGVKLETLLSNLQADGGAIAQEDARAGAGEKTFLLTRKQVLGAISDVLRDVFEPLELIRTSLDMMTSKAFGTNAVLQANVLHLAIANTDLIKKLLGGLRSVSQVIPASPGADRDNLTGN